MFGHLHLFMKTFSSLTVPWIPLHYIVVILLVQESCSYMPFLHGQINRFGIDYIFLHQFFPLSQFIFLLILSLLVHFVSLFQMLVFSENWPRSLLIRYIDKKMSGDCHELSCLSFACVSVAHSQIFSIIILFFISNDRNMPYYYLCIHWMKQLIEKKRQLFSLLKCLEGIKPFRVAIQTIVRYRRWTSVPQPSMLPFVSM